MATRQYIGARYVPKFYEGSNGTEWTANTAYEPLTIVTRNGNSYTSKKLVPASVGAPESYPDYWASTGIYNAQIEGIRTDLLNLETEYSEDKAKYVTPDDFTGTDAEKLQACFDYFGESGSGTIVLNRNYVITNNIKIRHKTNYGNDNRITVIALGRNNTVNMGNFHFMGYDTEARHYGGVTFRDVNFIGSAYLFDFTYMVRVSCDNCQMSDFSYIAYSENYLQTLYIINCLIRDIKTEILHITAADSQHYIVDTRLIGNVIEQCEKIVDAYRVDGLTINENCIEAFHNCPIRIYGYAETLNICNNYFESNNVGYNTGDIDRLGVTIDLKDVALTQSVNITSNQFSYRTGDKIIILPAANISRGWQGGYINIKDNNCVRSGTFIVSVPDTRTIPLYNANISGNLGAIDDPNNLCFTIDQKLKLTVTSEYSNNISEYVLDNLVDLFATDVNITPASTGWFRICTFPIAPQENVPFTAWDSINGESVRCRVTGAGNLETYVNTVNTKTLQIHTAFTRFKPM